MNHTHMEDFLLDIADIDGVPVLDFCHYLRCACQSSFSVPRVAACADVLSSKHM